MTVYSLIFYENQRHEQRRLLLANVMVIRRSVALTLCEQQCIFELIIKKDIRMGITKFKFLIWGGMTYRRKTKFPTVYMMYERPREIALVLSFPKLH